MQTTVKKWGNSLGLRIPRALTEETGLTENAIVDINVVNGRIIVEVQEEEKSLNELLSEINEQNKHTEIPHDVKGSEEW